MNNYTCLTSSTFPLELKKELLDIMDEQKCSLLSAEQELILRLLKRCKEKE